MASLTTHGPEPQSTLVLPRAAPPAKFDDDALIATLADELCARWEKGDHVLADELLDRHPELWQAPELAVELIYEEICLRKERGESDFIGQALNRFPQWRRRLEVMFECHQLLEGQEPNFPDVGATVAGYRLLRRLGSGAGGKVFLAEQSALADRPVVIKLTASAGQEHLHLARLQHTHIVPLYAAHDDPVYNVRVLCMPFLGGATLDHLLRELSSCPLHERNGARMLQVLAAAGVSPCGPAAPLLSHCTYIEALCWIVARLADALDYACQLGLVHLDVKPANILIAADGQPMLLDFHLARTPLQRGDLPEGLGGTPPYMAPEQHDAINALMHGEPIPRDIDQRADIYALGAVLYEALAGTAPPNAYVPLSSVNRQVSRGLSDIVMKCLSADPADRFTAAAALAHDLRCHLDDLPLQFTSNRSWLERVHKWQRRRPAALRSLLVAVVSLAALAVLAWLACGQLAHDRGQSKLIAELEQVAHTAEQARILEQRRQTLHHLHTSAEHVRGLLEIEQIPRPRQAALARNCKELWHKREQLRHWPEFANCPEAVQDLMDVFLFGIDLQVRISTDPNEAKRAALNEFAAAEQFFGPNVILKEHRIRLQGLATVPPSGTTENRSLTDCLAIGRMALQHGELDTATQHLQHAVRLQPAGYWPNFYLGWCNYSNGRYAEAAASFSVCIGAMPDRASAYFNRALAFTKLGNHESALQDYSDALRLDPAMGKAAFNRALLFLQARRYVEAEADLERALHLGESAATVAEALRLARASSDR